MNISVKATYTELSEELESRIREKLSKSEAIIDSHQEDAHVAVEIGKTGKHHEKGDVFRVEIQGFVLGKSMRAVALGESLFSALDDASSEFQREVVDAKGKRETLIKKGGRKIKEMMRRFYR